MKIVCIGNFPPRQCGIATFTENLSKAILQAAKIHKSDIELEVIAMNDDGQTYDYPEMVKVTVNERDKEDYIRTAWYINESGADLCLLQHEYGIFGGESGVLLLTLLRNLKIPLVSIFHTVLAKPNFHQLEVLKKIAGYSSRIVIMNGIATGFLRDIYQVPVEKIMLIPHGVPDFESFRDQLLPKPASWENRKVILTFGLISRSKGIETMIKALPAIVNRFPEVLYMVLGKTHPHVLKYSGDEYREFLTDLASQLGVDKHVQFVNEYVSEIELMSYLAAADLYVTPYLNKAQITSGTLSYALSGGCAIVSTPYWHAEELLSNERGMLFDFGNHKQLSEKVNHLLEYPDLLTQLQHLAYNYGRTMAWPVIGGTYLSLFEQVIGELQTVKGIESHRSVVHHPEPDFNHLIQMTDDTGLLQHALYCVPHYPSGYSLDDNARALVVALIAWQKYQDPEVYRLIIRYLAYIIHMQQKDGSFLNFLTYYRTMMENDLSDDVLGRTCWALGYLVRYAPNDALFNAGYELLMSTIGQLDNLTYARGYANSILGLYHYSKRFPDHERILNLTVRLGKHLTERFHFFKQQQWPWFEETITYDNGIIPAALFKAYDITGQQDFLEVAEQSLEFLESKCFRNEWLSLIGNRKWLRMNGDYEIFAQQPIDAMAMVMMYESAYVTLKREEYLTKMKISFQWFFGDNDLGLPLLDSSTGGCMDGIEEFCINLNQGAESSISYLMARFIVDPYLSPSVV